LACKKAATLSPASNPLRAVASNGVCYVKSSLI